MLQQQYQDSVNQRESLKQRKVQTALRLERAAVLITALSDEKVCVYSYSDYVWRIHISVCCFKLFVMTMSICYHQHRMM